MLSQETIDAVRDRANLVDIISEVTSLKRAGSGFTGLCPFHAEKTPSFHVRSDGSFYHCFGCGESGNAITFVMKSRGLSFPEAVEDLAQRYNIIISNTKKAGDRPQASRSELYRVNLLADRYFRACLASAPSQVNDYIKARGLNAEALKAFSIGFAPRSWDGLTKALLQEKCAEQDLLRSGLVKRSPSGDLFDVFRGRLIFPIWVDTKRIAGFGGRLLDLLYNEDERKSAPKYLNSSESPIYQKSKIFFGGPQALVAMREEGQVFLVEGYMDLVGLWQAGVRNVLATCGTAVTENHTRRLARLVKRVRLLFDGDNAGRAAAARAFPLFLNTGIDVGAIFLPQDEDPDTFALKHAAQTGERLLELPKSTLLQAFVSGLFERNDARPGADLGPGLKGRLAEELGAEIRKVTNPVEKDELVREGARVLGIDLSALGAIVNGVAKAGQQAGTQRTAPTPEPEPQGSPESETVTRLSAKLLPQADREILRVAMTLKEKICSEILLDSELCQGLKPVTLMFIDELQHLVCANNKPERIKEEVRSLLATYGADWADLWRESHRMAELPDVNFKRSYEECRRSVKKTLLNQKVKGLQAEITSSQDEEQKMRLMEVQLTLKRKLQEIPT